MILEEFKEYFKLSSESNQQIMVNSIVAYGLYLRIGTPCIELFSL